MPQQLFRFCDKDATHGRDYGLDQHEVTSMKIVISAALLFTLGVTATSAWAQATPAPGTLPYKDCIRLDQINEWHVVDPRTAIVRTGPYQRYLVKLKASCDKLGIGNPGLMFVPSQADKAISPLRICGGVGEKVRARNQPGCAIESVSLIDQATFDGYRNHAKYHSVRTQQPGKTP
jgi:hypothetical protein